MNLIDFRRLYYEPDVAMTVPPPIPALPNRRNARIAAGVSLLLYIVACAMPALEFRKSAKPEVWVGAAVALLGWMGLLTGVIAWLANPLALLALVLAFFSQRPMPARIMAGLALLVGLTTFVALGMELPGDEGGVTKMRLALLPGAYLWFLSLFATLTATLLIQDNRK